MSTPFPPQPPASLTPSGGGPVEVRVVPASRGAEWWGDGLKMFMSRFGTWVGIVIVYVLISWVLNKVPYIGSIAHWLLIPVFVGGIMLGCDALAHGNPLRFSHLFDGFMGTHFIPLLTVGALNLLLTVVAIGCGVALIAAVIGLTALTNLGQLGNDPMEAARTFGIAGFLVIVFVLLLATVIFMITWFAPALIVLRGVRPVEAMSTSFRSCLRNWAPFTVYGVIGVAITLFAMIAFAIIASVVGFSAIMAFIGEGGALGPMIAGVMFLVFAYIALTVVIAPVIVGSVYAGYRDTLAS